MFFLLTALHFDCWHLYVRVLFHFNIYFSALNLKREKFEGQRMHFQGCTGFCIEYRIWYRNTIELIESILFTVEYMLVVYIF